jgi:hypothetical protein
MRTSAAAPIPAFPRCAEEGEKLRRFNKNSWMRLLGNDFSIKIS